MLLLQAVAIGTAAVGGTNAAMMVSATWPDMPDPGGTVNVVPTVPLRSNSLDNNNSTASCCFSIVSLG